MQIGTSGLRSKGIKRSTLGAGGQSSRSHKTENIFGGLVEASSSIPLGRVTFLILKNKKIVVKISKL